jgi:DNA-binding response OmpR family regulator
MSTLFLTNLDEHEDFVVLPLSMRLLLVEDDPMIGEIVLETLRTEGFAVDWIKDGAMADTALLAQAYDLVVLDLGLPTITCSSLTISMNC